jgi:hypothetical protein
MARYDSLTSFARTFARQVNKGFNKKKSELASILNKELTAGRKEIVESLMSKTGLKRKTFNDRLIISRANPKDTVLEGRLTPIYGPRIYMSDYPFDETIARGNKKVIRLTSPIYRKNMRTAFMSKDGRRMYLRTDSGVRSVKGRTVPRLFDQFNYKEQYESEIMVRIRAALNSSLDLSD